MSHLWCSRKIEGAQLLPADRIKLLPAIKAWERVDFKTGVESQLRDGRMQRVLVKCPYDRSVVTVVGPNHIRHDKAEGVDKPLCRKAVVSHQIATEFVLPTPLLRE
ncbi:MAG TPA: hypothetical protein VEY92_10485 [Pseudoxanthomonas sp.]|nr:hypothetical protein [Pseudoxanthomonas sp.]